jgi:hypothetical protein
MAGRNGMKFLRSDKGKVAALLDLTMKRFLETLILRSEFSEIITPFSNAK